MHVGTRQICYSIIDLAIEARTRYIARPSGEKENTLTNGDVNGNAIVIASSSKIQPENVRNERDDDELNAIEKDLYDIWNYSG